MGNLNILESLYPAVYIDLDETLILTEFHYSKPNVVAKDAFTFKLGGYWYSTQLRPCALDLIRYCRKLSICKIYSDIKSAIAMIVASIIRPNRV